MSDEEKKQQIVPEDIEDEIELHEEHEHQNKRHIRIRKRVFRKNKRKMSIRDKLIYYLIIFVGVALAVLITWYVLKAISDPNIVNGIIKD